MSVDLSEPVHDGWHSAAFCCNLLKASDGDLAEKYFPGSRALILRIKRNYARKLLKGGLQKVLYNALLPTIPPAFENVFARRFKLLEVPSLHIEPFKIDRIKHFAFELQSLYSKLPYGVPMIMLRTWSNGWFTTHRTLHEVSGWCRPPASMIVVDLIIWSTTLGVNICGRLSLPVQTGQHVFFPPHWPREPELSILILMTFLGVL